MNLKTFLLCVLALWGWAYGRGQQAGPVLLPLPQCLTYTPERFVLDRVRVEGDTGRADWQDWLREEGVAAAPGGRARTVLLELADTLLGVRGGRDEAYVLRVTADSLCVTACTPTGLYRALQTVRQLTVGDGRGRRWVTGCRITDWPAFRIRGFMHDVGRTYIPLDELKREVALLSRFKVNAFHWHLTENQAWRLESKIYPQLNDSANMTRMPGRYYTLDEARELADFCRRHRVLLIPEIDLPGHSAAFERAFGCSMQSPEGERLLLQLLDEVCAALDVPYLHIGTDEVAFTRSGLVPRVVAHVRARGKKVISWNPGWSYRPGEVDMTQLWSYRGRAQAGIPAIDSRFHYANHYDVFADLVALYNSRVYGAETGGPDLAGVVLAFWNDRYVEGTDRILAENNFYANMLALAERAWRGGGSCYFDGDGTLLRDTVSAAFRDFREFETRLLQLKRTVFAGLPFPYVRQTQVRWRVTAPFPNGGDLSRRFPPETHADTSYVYDGRVYATRTVGGAGVYLRHVWGDLVPGLFARPQENHTAYAFTWVHSPVAQEAGLVLEFQNYSRSESDLPPRPGTWDYKGSRAWLNGEEIRPPVWTGTQTERSLELPLGNENWVARPPVRVRLRQGWNRLLLKLPVGRFQTPEVRLVKWMFTAVFVTPDGRDALEGLTYSADAPSGGR